MKIIKKLKQRKFLWWSLVSCLGIWGYTEYQFSVDPLSYAIYPIVRQTSFNAFGEIPLASRYARASLDSVLRDLKFSEEGQSVFMSHNRQNIAYAVGNLMRWDIQTGELSVAFDPEKSPLNSGTNIDNFGVSDSQDWVVMTEREFGTFAQLRDGKSGKILPVFSGKDTLLVGIPVLSPDGSKLAGMKSTDGKTPSRVHVWDVRTGLAQQILSDTYQGADAIAFSPSGDSLAIARGSTLYLWDLNTKTERYAVSLVPGVGNDGGDYDNVYALSFSVDGSMISVQKGKCQVQQISTETGESLQILAREKNRYGYHNQSNGHTISPDGKTVACSLSKPIIDDNGLNNTVFNIELIDIATGKQKQIIRDSVYDDYNLAYTGQITFSPDSQTLARANGIGGDITLYRLGENKVTNKLVIEGYGYGLTYADDGKAILGINREGSIALFDADTGQKSRQVIVAGPSTANIGSNPSLSESGKTLLTTGNGGVTLWDNRGEQPELQHTVPIISPIVLNRALISPDNKYFLALGYSSYIRTEDYYESTFVIGDVKTGEIIHTIHNNENVYDAAFSPDGKTVATIYRDRTAKLHDLKTGKLLHTLALSERIELFSDKPLPSDSGRISFNNDGTQLVTSSDRSIQIWQPETGELLHTLRTRDGISLNILNQLYTNFAISPDGKWIAAAKPPAVAFGEHDNNIYIWDAQTGHLARSFVPLSLNPFGNKRITTLDFSPDSKLLMAGDHGNRITVWKLPPKFSLF